jgi:sec-independent protein translocase protein TatB
VLDPTKLIIIALVAFLFFGPDKLPQMARTAGRFIREFKKVQEQLETTIRSEMYKTEFDKKQAEMASTGVGVATATAETPASTAAATGGWEHEDPDEEEEE